MSKDKIRVVNGRIQLRDGEFDTIDDLLSTAEQVKEANDKLTEIERRASAAQIELIEELIGEGKLPEHEATKAKIAAGKLSKKAASRLIAIHSDGARYKRERREALEQEARKGLSLKPKRDQEDND